LARILKNKERKYFLIFCKENFIAHYSLEDNGLTLRRPLARRMNPLDRLFLKILLNSRPVDRRYSLDISLTFSATAATSEHNFALILSFFVTQA
jgi:hypothetical protein